MSAQRKTRGDSVLGTLPEERQLEIAAHARAHTLGQTVAWLRADGIKLGQTSLSEWLSAFVLRSQFRVAEQDSLNFIELLRKRRPQLSEMELQGWANEFFQVQAVKSGDAETFLAFATARHRAQMDAANLKLKEQQVGLDARRVALLEKKAAQADEARQVVESKATPEEKQLKLRQIFGMR
jgi:ActR/RegA family two-component response regulator